MFYTQIVTNSGMEQHYAVSMYANEMNERQQYYSRGTPPPLPPPKLKKKTSILKSPLIALKKVFSKSKPLHRQNSLVESEQRPRPSLRRQHSMLEPQRPPLHHMLMNTPELSQRQKHEYNHNIQRYFSRHEAFHPSDDAANGTYQNLESEAIYGNTGNTYYDQESMYANRAYIEFERRSAALHQSELRPAMAPSTTASQSKGSLVRRHSMADRAPSHYRMQQPPRRGTPSSHHVNHRETNEEPVQREDIYMTRSGAFMMQNSYNRREEEAIYQSRREMHRDHLYQSKAEMQQRLHQSRIETQRAHSESPMYASRREVLLQSPSATPDTPSKEQVLYQSRQELKDRGFRTRTQLRDHIYQSRREAMQSMAEPVYVSKREIKHDPIYESRESVVNQASGSRDVSPRTPSTSNGGSPVIDEPKNDLNSKSSSVEDALELILNLNIGDSATEQSIDDDEATLTNANQSDLQKSKSPLPENIETHSQTVNIMPLSPRNTRSPYHISNMIKRTAPPEPPLNSNTNGDTASTTSATLSNAHASHTSIETQYTQYTQSSFASSNVGPPNAHSTPYASEMALVGLRSVHSALPPLREQSTTSGVFDENGGTLCDNVWNVSIHIPKGAIKAGIQQEIYFTVTDPRLSQAVGGPPLDMENGWFKHTLYIFFFKFVYRV